MNWIMSDAKNRFSEVLNLAETNAPQVITRRDRDFVLMTGDDYRKLTANEPSFVDWILKSPPLDKLELPKRDRPTMRELDL